MGVGQLWILLIAFATFLFKSAVDIYLFAEVKPEVKAARPECWPPAQQQLPHQQQLPNGFPGMQTGEAMPNQGAGLHDGRPQWQGSGLGFQPNPKPNTLQDRAPSPQPRTPRPESESTEPLGARLTGACNTSVADVTPRDPCMRESNAPDLPCADRLEACNAMIFRNNMQLLCACIQA